MYPGRYASGSSLAAALLDGLFEHPAGVFSCYAIRTDYLSKFCYVELVSSGLLARWTDASEEPEAYPPGYVEDLNDARTLLADFFSILGDN